MGPGDNINFALHDYSSKHKEAKGKTPIISQFHTFKESFNGEPFALILMAGAGAPIANLANWMEAGLGGCTGEACALVDQKKDRINFILLNSMTPEEQAVATGKILESKGKNLAELNILNDHGLVFKEILGLTDDQIKTVDGRTAYLPQALIFNGAGALMNVLTNRPVESGKAREAQPYVTNIATELVSVSVSQYSRRYRSPDSPPPPPNNHGENISSFPFNSI